MARGKSEFVGIAEAAQVLGVSERQARNIIQHHGAEMIGGSWIIRRADLAKVPKDRKPGPKPKAKRSK